MADPSRLFEDDYHDMVSDTPENSNATDSRTGSSSSSDTAPSDHTEVQSQLSSDDGAHIPSAPVNSPYNMSLMGDVAYTGLNSTSLAERLHLAMPAALGSPPRSIFGERNKGKRIMLDASRPLFQQLFKPSSPSRMKKARRRARMKLTGASSAGANSPTKMSSTLSRMDSAIDDPWQQATFEHSVWAELAEEDVTNALARLARLARDEQQKDDPTRPVSEYYSARLAKLIAKGEIEFDADYLKEK